MSLVLDEKCNYFIAMKFILTFFILAILISCTPRQDEQAFYIVQYKAQTVTPESFLKRLIIQSYIKYKEARIDKLKESSNLETLKKETLSLIIQEIFVNNLANKHSLVIKDSELKEWILERSKGTKPESLNLFLNTNGMKTNDWNRMFKNQLLMHKVKEFFKTIPDETEKTKEKNKRKSTSKNNKTYVQLGVISFEDKHEAETAYIRLRKRQTTFEKLLESKTGSEKYQWLPLDSVPFASSIKNLRIKRVSKVIQTDWGHSLVMINKREKRSTDKENDAEGQVDVKWASALKEFKESSDLKINFDLFYGLKLKR